MTSGIETLLGIKEEAHVRYRQLESDNLLGESEDCWSTLKKEIKRE